MPTRDFLSFCKERGYFHQCTDEAALQKLFADDNITAYIGFDCTAPSLHVGSLLQIMLLRHLKAFGHTPIVLLGGGTTKVGDPSGKDEARKMLTEADIAENKTGIARIFDVFLGGATIVDNAEWLDKLSYISFLRDIGKHFSINRMLAFDSVKLRLEREQNLSFLEFNYMLLQAYDFVELQKRYNCRVQIGGSDQWGNIVNGVELGRKLGVPELFGLTTPLITTASGAKMGKTAQGAIWLTADRLSPYDYWQFWRNTADADVGRFLRLFTELPLDEIAKLAALKDSEINEAKKILANEATALCHGREAAAAAAETAHKTFAEGQLGADLPVIEIASDVLAAGIPAFQLFRDAGLAESGGDAKRLIRGGGAKINDQPVSNEAQLVTAQNLQDGAIKLSAGKKRHVVVKIL